MNALKSLAAAALLSLVPLPANAEGPGLGIDFEAMPLDLKLRYITSDGGAFVEIYRGRQGDHHVMERYTSRGDLRWRAFYNAEGHLAHREYADGNIRRFYPHHCKRVVGACVYLFANSQGRNGSGISKLTQDGDTLIYAWTIKETTRQVHYTLGAYNLVYAQVDADGKGWSLERTAIFK